MLTDGMDGEGKVRRCAYTCSALCYLMIAGVNEMLAGEIYITLSVDVVNVAVIYYYYYY